MSKKFPGFYLYYDWLDALETLPSKKAMTIISNLRNYVRDGIEPPALDGYAGSLQTIFAAQLKRSKTNAENGRNGGLATQKKADGEKENPSSKRPMPGLMTPEEIQSVAFSDYLQIRRRFDAEEAMERAIAEGLQHDPYIENDSFSL